MESFRNEEERLALVAEQDALIGWKMTEETHSKANGELVKSAANLLEAFGLSAYDGAAMGLALVYASVRAPEVTGGPPLIEKVGW